MTFTGPNKNDISQMITHNKAGIIQHIVNIKGVRGFFLGGRFIVIKKGL